MRRPLGVPEFRLEESDETGRSLDYAILSACERFGLAPELFLYRLDRRPDGSLGLEFRTRAEQMKLLAYDQLRTAEETKKDETMMRAVVGVPGPRAVPRGRLSRGKS